MPMATKLGRVLTYDEELLPISSNDPSIKWSCEITRQNKYVISPLALGQWTPNMTR